VTRFAQRIVNPLIFRAAEVGVGDGYGTIVAYPDFSLASSGSSIITIDKQLSALPQFTSEGSSVTNSSSYGMDGRGGTRYYPPVTDAGYGGEGAIDLFNAGGTRVITDFWWSYIFTWGSTFAQNNTWDAVKKDIVHSQGGSNGTFNDPYRPIHYLDSRIDGIAPTNSMVMYPAQGTSQYFSESHPDNNVNDGDGRYDGYLAQTTGTYASKPTFAPGTWICVENHYQTTQGGSYANGVIRQKLWARGSGTPFSDLDINCPWNRDPAAPFNKEFYEIQVYGGGYFNGATITPGTNNYTESDRYIRFGVGIGPQGPPSDF
jgi:hypothetical protein